jgi:hypothetical protein
MGNSLPDQSHSECGLEALLSLRFVFGEVSGAARAGMPPIHTFRTSKCVPLGESRLWLESTTNILASILRFYFNEP